MYLGDCKSIHCLDKLIILDSNWLKQFLCIFSCPVIGQGTRYKMVAAFTTVVTLANLYFFLYDINVPRLHFINNHTKNNLCAILHQPQYYLMWQFWFWNKCFLWWVKYPKRWMHFKSQLIYQTKLYVRIIIKFRIPSSIHS